MTPLLVFDQFEELFTRVESPHAAQRHFEQFLNDVAHLVSGREPEWYETACGTDENLERPAYTRQTGVCKVVLSFREDYLANVKGLSRIIPSIDRIFVRLEPMTRKAAAMAVCEAGGHLMDADAPEEKRRTSLRIIRKVTRAPGRLGVTHTVDSALLSLFCKELNDERKRRTPPLIDRALIESAEASRIFEGFYARAMRMVNPLTQDFIERNLVLPGTRSRWPAAEQTALAAGVPAADLATLSRLRIIRPDVSAGVARFELTHDVLIDVVLDSRARREEQSRHEQERQALEAEAERTKRGLIEEWQHKRVVWSSVAAVVALLLLVLVMAALWNVSRLQRQQQARMFADAAYSELGQDVRVSAMLARRAIDEAARAGIPMPLAQITLNSALRAPFVQVRHRLSQLPLAVVANDTGALIALVSARQIEVRRAPDFAQPKTLQLNRDVLTVIFDESDALFIFYADTSIARVDVWQEELRPIALAGPVGHGRVATSAALRADGGRAIVSSIAPTEPLQSQQEGAWLSIYSDVTKGWQPPIEVAAGSLFAVSGNAAVHATLNDAGLLTVAGADGFRSQHQVGAATVLELSSDGTRALAVQRSGQNVILRIVRFDDGRMWSGTLPRAADVTSARFSRHDSRVAIAQADGALSVWDVEAERAVFQVPYAQRFAFSHDSEELLTWSSSQNVERWNARTGQALDRVGRHDDLVSSAVTVSAAAPIVTIAGRELYLWSRPALDRDFATKHTGAPTTAAFSANGDRIATAEPGAVHVYDLVTGELRDSFEEAEPTALAFSPDGEQLAVGTREGDVVIHGFTARAQSRIRPGRSPDSSASSGVASPVTALTFVPATGHLIIARTGEDEVDSRISLHDLSTQRGLREVPVQGRIVTLAAGDDSQVVAGVDGQRRYDDTAIASETTVGIRFEFVPLTGTLAPSNTSFPSSAGTDSAAPEPPIDTRVDLLPPPPPPAPEASLRSPLEEGIRCQVGRASLNADATLGVGVTSCERVVAHWRNLQEPANTLNVERPVAHVAVAPVGDFIAVAFVNGAVWMYHITFPSRPVVVRRAGSPSVSWLGFTNHEGTPVSESGMRLVVVAADRRVSVYPLSSAELLRHADTRGSQWRFNQADCARYFGATESMNPCSDAGFWTTIRRSMTSFGGR